MNKIKVIYGWEAKIHKEITTNLLVVNTELLYLLPSDVDISREKREINDIGNTQRSYFMFRFKRIKDEYEQPVFGKIVNVESRCENFGNIHHSIRVTLRLSLTKDEFEKIAHLPLAPSKLGWRLMAWDLYGVLIASDENIEDVKRIAIAYLMIQS